MVFHTLDGFIIALDAKTGKELWVVKHAWPEKGETHTGPTLIAENLVIGGFGGDEFAARGRLCQPTTSRPASMVWSCHSTGSDKDVCLTPDSNKANPHFGDLRQGPRHLQLSGRRVEDRRRRAMGLVQLRSRAEDGLCLDRQPWSLEPGPSLRLYTGEDHTHEKCNDGTYDNKWSMTIFGRKVENGEVAFAYQMTPFDQ